MNKELILLMLESIMNSKKDYRTNLIKKKLMLNMVMIKLSSKDRSRNRKKSSNNNKLLNKPNRELKEIIKILQPRRKQPKIMHGTN